MNSQKFWMAFLDTGAPEMYLLFKKTRVMEEHNVSDTQGPCAASNELQ